MKKIVGVILKIVGVVALAALISLILHPAFGIGFVLLLVLINRRYRRCATCQRVSPRGATICSHCGRAPQN